MMSFSQAIAVLVELLVPSLRYKSYNRLNQQQKLSLGLLVLHSICKLRVKFPNSLKGSKSFSGMTEKEKVIMELSSYIEKLLHFVVKKVDVLSLTRRKFFVLN